MRHRSFTRAAEELNLTHSAVSHHMRSLEQQLGTTLFRRVGARMIPTSVGARLAERVRIGMTELDEAMNEAKAGITPDATPAIVRLEISVMTDLAAQWLIPRLDRFGKLHPGIDLVVRIHADISAPDPYSVDVGIWHQRVEIPGFVTRKLLDDFVIAVCSPALIASVPGFTVADTPKLPMLRFAYRSWRDWQVAAGLPPDCRRMSRRAGRSSTIRDCCCAQRWRVMAWPPRAVCWCATRWRQGSWCKLATCGFRRVWSTT